MTTTEGEEEPLLRHRGGGDTGSSPKDFPASSDDDEMPDENK